MALSACSQEIKFVSMLLGEMTNVKNIYIIYEDNQGTILLANNWQEGILQNILIFVIMSCGTLCKTRILISSTFGMKLILHRSGKIFLHIYRHGYRFYNRYLNSVEHLLEPRFLRYIEIWTFRNNEIRDCNCKACIIRSHHLLCVIVSRE